MREITKLYLFQILPFYDHYDGLDMVTNEKENKHLCDKKGGSRNAIITQTNFRTGGARC